MTQALINAINSAMEAIREYEESHSDAGDSYAHLPQESWSTSDDKNLSDFMREHGIDARGLEPETLAEIALDNFTMTARHMFHGGDGDYFACGAYPLQEIETQLSYASLSEAAGFTVTRDDVEAVQHDVDCYIGSISEHDCLAYLTSDVVWCADISADTLRTAIAECEA